jgi:hypothetical protein
VFSKPEFVAHATRNWVLVKVDSPRKTKLPFHESTQNAKLQREFAVRGFPTIVAVDAQGTRMAEIKGYVRGGPKAFRSTGATAPSLACMRHSFSVFIQPQSAQSSDPELTEPNLLPCSVASVSSLGVLCDPYPGHFVM